VLITPNKNEVIMSNQYSKIVINSCPIVAMFEVPSFDDGWYAIVFDHDDDDPEGLRYGTATWREGDCQWNNGNYAMTYQEALVDALDRAGLAKPIHAQQLLAAARELNTEVEG